MNLLSICVCCQKQKTKGGWFLVADDDSWFSQVGQTMFLLSYNYLKIDWTANPKEHTIHFVTSFWLTTPPSFLSTYGSSCTLLPLIGSFPQYIRHHLLLTYYFLPLQCTRPKTHVAQWSVFVQF